MEIIKKENIYIVVPAYNEGTVIGEVVRGIRQNGYEKIIVVDDGSADDTYNEALRTGAIVFRHRINRGKGAAVKTGLVAARRMNAEAVVTIDGDGQHDSRDIELVISPLVFEDKDVVLGTRTFETKNISLYKIVANRLANLLVRAMTGIWVSDSQSGFRAFNTRAIRLLFDVGDKYEYDSEIIRQIARNGLKYKEVPIRVYYTEYSINKSQKQGIINGVKTFYRLVWNIIS